MTAENSTTPTFSLWATSDAHVVREELAEGCDPAAVSRESMRIAVGQADGPNGFSYDIGVQLGDLLDYDHETIAGYEKYVAQLAHSSKDRHCWYHVGGNNDENSVLNDGVSIDNEYYRKYIDPVGVFTATSGVDNAKRPYPVMGTYERYSIDIGNMRCLFLSDRNDLPAPYGRGEGGFYVDGAITMESYQWLVDQVIRNPDRIIAIFCHHPLKDTTIGTSIDESWQGQYMSGNHPHLGDNPTTRLQSTLHQVYDVDDFDSPKFRNLLGQNSGIVDLWISGHVHHRVDEVYNGKGKYAHAYGGHHLNVGTICRYRHFVNIISAQSTLFGFVDGSDHVESSVYVHDHPSIAQGFYEPEHRSLALKKAFSEEYAPAQPVAPSSSITDVSMNEAEIGGLVFNWGNPNTGVLMVRKRGCPSEFVPTDDQTYYVGQSVEDGDVVFMGVSTSFCDGDVTSGTDYCYTPFAYNAGSDQIKYSTETPAIIKATAR